MKKHWQKHQKRSSAGGREAVMEGVIQHHGNFAFLLNEAPGGSDVFLGGRGLELAMDGDRVQASVRREGSGRLAGNIIKIVKRARNSITGVLKRDSRGWTVNPDKGGGSPAMATAFAPGIKPIEDHFAVLEITRWPDRESGAAGRVTEIIGDSSDLRARITSLLRARGINDVFPPEAQRQAEAWGVRLDPTHWAGREELFDLDIFTIDGADAKDFDDAVSLQPLGGGILRLGVHIADVSYYVKEKTALDNEAYERATSVYLPNRVVPMLPPSLSDNLCSLVPDQERLTMTIFMEVDQSGAVLRRRVAETVIKSCRRFTYEEVQEVLDGKKVGRVTKQVGEAVKRMGELATVLYKARIKRGALDFNLPEYKVATDEAGRPVKVEQRPRLASHRLIEEFMLLANEAAATELMAAGIPFLHRRHDEPDPEKIRTLAETLGALGLSAGHLTGRNLHKNMQDVLRQAEGNPLEAIMNSLIVRSMKQAVYSPVSAGHFGIASKAYCHFTSPIRRYPDLLTHRALKELLSKKRSLRTVQGLESVGKHCSERERLAAEAEHKATDILRAELLRSQIGSVMDGVVTSVTGSGAFIRLGDTGAEGLLRDGGFQPGDEVRVLISGVDIAKGQIDLRYPGKAQEPQQSRELFQRKQEQAQEGRPGQRQGPRLGQRQQGQRQGPRQGGQQQQGRQERGGPQPQQPPRKADRREKNRNKRDRRNRRR